MIENLERSKKMLQLLIECKGKKMQVLHDATSDVVSQYNNMDACFQY